MTKIAVTGAGGFLGRHVLECLAGHDVDIVATARNPEKLPSQDRLRRVALDIHKPVGDPFADLGRPDILLHLAWGGLPDYRNTFQLKTELPAQIAFLERMLQGGLKSLTVTGTCLEYGMQSGRLAEDMPCEPILPYPQAKLKLLDHLKSLRAQNPFALTWARLFYMYGDGQQDRSLYSQFLAAHARGDESFDMSGGEQLRDFLPVERVADILCDLALSGRDNGVVNVCSGKPVSVRDLVSGWARQLDWDVQLNLGVYSYPEYEPMEFWGDNRRMNEVLAAA